MGLRFSQLETIGFHGNFVCKTEWKPGQCLENRVTSGEPRKLTARPDAKPWVNFTGGALEHDAAERAVATLGGILISPDGKTYCLGPRYLKGCRTTGRQRVESESLVWSNFVLVWLRLSFGKTLGKTAESSYSSTTTEPRTVW